MMEAIRTEAPFTLDEVKAVVWACGGKKALRPDGFMFKFIKNYSDIICDDVMRFTRHFEDFGTLGCLYKIITKILATIIKLVIGNIIGDVQSTYMEGQNIPNGSLIINEICARVKHTKKVLLFKVDFDKAFDSINWEYLDYVFSQIGFGNNKWRSWIRGCLTSSHVSVILNGFPTKEFDIAKGVRQGDPLSLFLYIISMEGFNISFKSVSENVFLKVLKSRIMAIQFPICFIPTLHYLLENGPRSSLKNLAHILRCFLSQLAILAS